MASIKPRGRPTKYTEELANQICDLIREGKSERTIAKMEGMPEARTMIRWKADHVYFCQQSIQARAESAELFNDRRMEKADQLYRLALEHLETGTDFPKGVVEAFKVAISEDARQAALRDDRKFSSRKRLELAGDKERPLQIEATVDYDLSKLSINQLTQLENLLVSAVAKDEVPTKI